MAGGPDFLYAPAAIEALPWADKYDKAKHAPRPDDDPEAEGKERDQTDSIPLRGFEPRFPD
jgi:hypothetical protein